MDPLLAGIRLNRAAARIQAVYRGKRARDKQLEFLLNEVLQTERSYVQDLTKAIEHYFKPLRELSLGPQRHRLVEADEVAAIFGNLEDVLVIAEELLARIAQEIEGGGSNLGEIFISHSFALKLYARYVSNYEAAAERLHAAEKNKKFVVWLRERRIALEETTERTKYVFFAFGRSHMVDSDAVLPVSCRLGSRCCDLRNLLIKPVQRIPRYELLLKELVRVKNRLGQDDPSLAEAVQSLMDVGRHNNDVIFHSQNRETLYAVQKKLGNTNIVADGRILLRDGPVMKVCRKDHKPYRLVLFSDQLLTVTENGSKYKLHHRIMLADPATSASIQPVARLGDTALRIESCLKSFICYCDTVPETKEWADALQRAIKQCQEQDSAGEGVDEAAPLVANRSQGMVSMARPVWVQDTEITACMLCRKNFTVRTALPSASCLVHIASLPS